jgi:hypothetical protein
VYADFGFSECWQGSREIFPEVSMELHALILSVVQSIKESFLGPVELLDPEE